jgi:autotransporter-associated beta strand protein
MSRDTLNLNAAFSGTALADWEVINLDATDADFTVDSGISGAGAVNILGTGTVTLGGTSALTGDTTVSGGTLNVTGSLQSSAVTVETGATLTGIGTIGALTADSGSTVRAGDGAPSFGTLSVNGNATLASGSTLSVGVFGSGSAEHSRLDISGTATLAGDIYVDVTSGNTGSGALAQGTTITNVLVAGDGLVRCWEVDGGRELWRVGAEVPAAEVRVAASSDGRYAALVLTPEAVAIHAPGSGAVLGNLRHPLGGAVTALGFSADGRLLGVLAGLRFHVWNLAVLEAEGALRGRGSEK